MCIAKFSDSLTRATLLWVQVGRGAEDFVTSLLSTFLESSARNPGPPKEEDQRYNTPTWLYHAILTSLGGQNCFAALLELAQRAHRATVSGPEIFGRVGHRTPKFFMSNVGISMPRLQKNQVIRSKEKTCFSAIFCPDFEQTITVNPASGDTKPFSK